MESHFRPRRSQTNPIDWIDGAIYFHAEFWTFTHVFGSSVEVKNIQLLVALLRQSHNTPVAVSVACLMGTLVPTFLPYQPFSSLTLVVRRHEERHGRANRFNQPSGRFLSNACRMGDGCYPRVRSSSWIQGNFKY